LYAKGNFVEERVDEVNGFVTGCSNCSDLFKNLPSQILVAEEGVDEVLGGFPIVSHIIDDRDFEVSEVEIDLEDEV
jgi:hypothetical protein